MDSANIKRVAILLPFSAKSSRLREEANSMLRAAEMALFAREDHDVLLIAHDSKGSVEGAKQAARKAVSQGADIILARFWQSPLRRPGKSPVNQVRPSSAFRPIPLSQAAAFIY